LAGVAVGPVRVFARRKGNVHQGEFGFGVFQKTLGITVVVSTGVEPVVGFGQCQLLVAGIQADIEALVGHGGLHLMAAALIVGLSAGGIIQQLFHGDLIAGVADDLLGPDFLAIRHTHANGLAPVNQKFRNIGVGEHIASALLDGGDDAGGNAGGAAD